MPLKVMKTDKVEPIYDSHIHLFVECYDSLGRAELKIVNRVNYVVRKSIQLLGGEVDWWDWPNGGGEIDGSLTPEMLDGDCFEVEGNLKQEKSEGMEILYENEVWDFSFFTFPTKFLYEDFEKDIIEGRRLFVEKERVKREKAKLSREAKKKMKEEIKKSALKKLTPEERKALKL